MFLIIAFATGLYKINVKIIAIIPANSFAPNFTNPFLYPKKVDKIKIAIKIISIIIPISIPPL